MDLPAAPAPEAMIMSPDSGHVFRIHPVVRPYRTFDGNDLHGSLYTLGEFDSTEMEFFLPWHMVMLLPDGISGGCEWNTSNQAGRLSVVAPNAVLFNPADEYLWFRKRRSKNQSRMLLLIIRPTVLNRLDSGELDVTDVQFSQQIGLEDQIVCQALLAIQQEMESPGINSRPYVDVLLMLLLNRLDRCASNLSDPKPKPCYAKGGLANWRLKRALQMLESNHSRAPSLSEISYSIGLTPASFSRAFKQSTGLPPHRYLLVHRVNRAKEMMKDHNRMLTQISLDCGFSCSSQFTAVFKRFVGKSPRAYRRSL
jgi:AraC-like DNA-binding protein